MRFTISRLSTRQAVAADPENGYSYDEGTHSIRFQGAAKKKAFTAKIDITYEEHK